MPSPNPAWLFDVYPHPIRSSLLAWVKHGSDIHRFEIPYQSEFHIREDAQPLSVAEAILANDPRVERFERTRARLWLRGEPEEVLRVRPRSFHTIAEIATDLRRKTDTKGFLFFDVDHAPESRWMHAQGLFAMCRLEVGPEGPRLALAPGEDRWAFHYPTPDLRTLRLEVRSQSRGERGVRAALGGKKSADRGGNGEEDANRSFDDPIASLRFGETTLEVTSDRGPGSERDLLLSFGRALRRLDPDVLITTHGDRWDIPYLLRRIRANHLENIVRLGRDPDPSPDRPDQKAKSIHTYGRWLFKTHAYYLRGRWHIDLSKKTLDAEDDRKDLHGIVYLTRVSNRRAQDVNRNGAGFALQQMQIDSAIDLGVALPWKRNLAEDWKDPATLCAVDRGGQIVNPEPGIYEDVAACDFSGYYPSIVVRHNLSSDTINCACCPDGPVIPELGFRICRRHQGHQSEILRRLAPHRRLVKAILRQAENGLTVDEDLVAKAKAVKSEQKALGVVCFGYFRYRNARFGCAEVHQAIQSFGRAGMTRARELAQEAGFEMIHALTDSAFLQKRGVTRADATRMTRTIAREVGLPMDVEGIYRWVVFLPSKTHSTSSEVGVPNRYYGLFEDGRLKVRGIEVQRHITPPWIYDAQQAMLDVLSKAEDAAGFRARIPEALACAERAVERLRRREVDAADLGLMIQSTRAVEEYVANTNTRSALERLADAGIDRHPGEYVKYIVVRTEGPRKLRAKPVELLGKPEPLDFVLPRIESPGEGEGDSEGEGDGEGKGGGAETAIRGLEVYDVEFYVRLLARSVETLLSPFGYSEERVFRWLMGRAVSPVEGGFVPFLRPARPRFVRGS
jgi:DNA polymerase elongation subunit (family B)